MDLTENEILGNTVIEFRYLIPILLLLHYHLNKKSYLNGASSKVSASPIKNC